MLPETTERPSPAALRAKIARACRAGDAEAAGEARAEYRTRKLEEHIERVLSEAPPLSQEQRDRLRVILGTDEAAR